MRNNPDHWPRSFYLDLTITGALMPSQIAMAIAKCD
jgi:hypothetical protein